MKVEYKEIFKLKVMLDNKNIPYEFLDRCLVMDNALYKPYYQIIVYEPGEELEEKNRIISVIQGYGTYGEKLDLLEIQGCLTKKEQKEDSVKGFLTANEVYKRIVKRYFEIENKKIEEVQNENI